MAKATTLHNMGEPDLSRRGHSSSTCGSHCHLHPFWRAFYVGVSKPGKNDEAGLTAEILLHRSRRLQVRIATKRRKLALQGAPDAVGGRGDSG